MTSSTMPLAERLDCHPVHRATALLHQVLLSPPAISPDPAEIWDHCTLRFNTSPTGLGDGAASVTYQASLSALLGLTAIKDRDISCQPPVSYQRDVPASDAPPEELAEEETLDGTAEAQLQGLVQAFHRRQQQASLIVACSVITAVVLTIGGLALLFNVTSSNAKMAPTVRTSAVSTGPAVLEHVRVTTNRSAKTDAQPHAPSQATLAAQVVRATSGRPLALASRLPHGSARYLLLRGLPENAELSAGRRTGPGAWLVKGDDASNLVLSLGMAANGDYPLDVYQLETGNGPQARHQLILRVGPQELAAVSESDAGILRERAQRLLGDGDIAAARHLLTEAAEQGYGDAAYELALTYDREVLAKAGIRGVDSDAGVARAWYEYAAQDGHTEAGQRLQTLTKRRAAS